MSVTSGQPVPVGTEPASDPHRRSRWNPANPNHHLWNNNGWWFAHYTIYPTPQTKERIRESLKTDCVETARIRRDLLLARRHAEGVLARPAQRPPGI